MKRLIIWCVAVMTGIASLAPAFASTKEQQLQELLELLDQELANWESSQSTNDSELADAITTIYNLGITRYSTPGSYMASNVIRRDEAATMFYRLAEKLNLLGSQSTNNCRFSDIGEAHSDLQGVVENSCRYGLFKGDRGRFMPTSSITNAQAVTVMTRMLDGYKSEQTSGHWALNYHEYMKNAGYISGLPAESTAYLDRTITRGDIAIILARVYNKKK